MSCENRTLTGRLGTIGARLSVLGMAASFLIAVTICIVLYFGLKHALHREIDNFLEGEVHEFSAILAEGDAGDLHEIEREIRLELGSRRRGDLTFRLLSATGALVLTSAQSDNLPSLWKLEPIEEERQEITHYATLEVGDAGKRVRTCSQWILFRGASHLAQVSYLLDGVDHSLEAFRRICGIAVMLAALLSLLGGRILAKRLLRPIRELTDSARLISAARPVDRLVRTGSGDELDRLAETLNQMLDRIHQQVCLLQQFTADASHELRTPLTALRGAAEIALTGKASAEDLRRTIQESIERYDYLSRIAEDLLLLARLDSGDPVLKRETVRLDKAVEDVIDLYEPYAAERDIVLSFHHLHGEVWTLLDGRRIRQVVSNLIDNAVQYMGRPGKIAVDLQLSNGEAVLTVTDDGAGIPVEDMPLLFDRFYRGDRSRAGGAKHGAGLGLSICRSIVEAHGGRIAIDSTLGRGTVVTTHLPTSEGDSEAAPCPDIRGSDSLTREAWGATYR